MDSKKIMVCDDDQGILDVLQMLLELEGFEVLPQINSIHVIKEILTYSPDILLLDLWMPVLSGDQILKAIRNTPEIKKLPVIVLSASGDGNKIAMEVGADGFIAKPFDLDDIITKINSLLPN
ncbi:MULTISPECIES: response regulator [Sphingobacterium]|jgi:DNA-binding response OmpR family regulator|uniref:response regulator n=1 Tax=Sphingobacterium TaxID=28453 RepID=UPI0004E5FF1B|nr:MULTISPECIES: response regulator [Sphingobacterium]UXD70690.1 response regulator [Sphingobacterium faecium]WGQ14350.1 response regulator [Sphingobacterium faecium]CDT17368.1 Response regulators consisting of a CheY-like receiver domain and a HTH DNA-binding domain [Sphingobacterium sp. PM2-P1-29]SJN52620.1 Copper-sensing two-component system response regulator CpxR [Sphingobacterium faecium PCAi_F2.5]